jgi:hypothetical protein
MRDFEMLKQIIELHLQSILERIPSITSLQAYYRRKINTLVEHHR